MPPEVFEADDSKPPPELKVVENDAPVTGKAAIEEGLQVDEAIPEYRVYKRRWIGLVALFLLNVSAGMNWLWFSPISITASQQLDMSLTRINWLANSVNLIYIPVSLMVPPICARYGLRNACIVAAFVMTVGSWIRDAGTRRSLSPNSSYALILIGQMLTGVSQPWFQVVGPKYSELWFDLKGRTTATAIIAISNPVGCAVGEILSPLFHNVRHSIRILAAITTILSLASLTVLSAPPTPPTFSGSRPSPGLMEVMRASIGRARPGELMLSVQQRLDFALVALLFSVLVSASDTFFILVDEIFNPYGYSNDAAGNMGGALIISGIIAAIATAPLFDRVLTRHLGLTSKILVPILSVAWLSLIWDVRPHNYAGLYAVFVFIGIGSFILLPVALEIGVEVTSSAESSSAILWCGANIVTTVFVGVMDGLRAPVTANPPQNMKRGLIFLGVVVMVCCFFPVFALQAKQVRREVDQTKANEQTTKDAER